MSNPLALVLLGAILLVVGRILARVARRASGNPDRLSVRVGSAMVGRNESQVRMSTNLPSTLRLRAGEGVRVRSLDEILSTLDRQGCLDSLPFMPEMADYCGCEFRVFKRFDKYNDYAYRTGMRHFKDAVLLEGVRCAGRSHGSCQALCQIIWKEAWLTRAEDRRPRRSAALEMESVASRVGDASAEHHVCTKDDLLRATQRAEVGGGLRFSCQATELKEASSALPWWDVRQYWRDYWSGNVRAAEMVRGFVFFLFSLALRVGGYRLLIGLYNRVQRIRGGDAYPRQGTLKKTPALALNLKPGELVRIKSHNEILATLDTNNRNRGLWFDAEMLKYCGGTYTVLGRVERVIDNKSGKMITLPNDCIVLEGVTNRGNYHRFNPRNEYLFWREIWLERSAGVLAGC